MLSRALAATAYLAFGIGALVSPRSAVQFGLPLFTLVQGLWWANSLADTRRLRPDSELDQDTPRPADLP